MAFRLVNGSWTDRLKVTFGVHQRQQRALWCLMSLLLVSTVALGSEQRRKLVVADASISTRAAALGYKVSDVEFGSVPLGSERIEPLLLFNASTDGRALTVFNTWLAESDARHYRTNFEGPVTLGAGESLVIDITYTPRSTEEHIAPLYVSHDGDAGLDVFALTGRGEIGGGAQNRALNIELRQQATNPSFAKSLLHGTESILRPTSLQFGPDGRLYVADMLGDIRIYEVERESENDYRVEDIETISLIKSIPNHDDDGSPNPAISNRLVTGLLVTGTASAPVVYVASSDPRIGGGNSHTDTNLDTNSGVLSRLSLVDGEWEKLDLVRGLPRSEENHHTNGMQLDESTQTLFVAQGGNTNQGAPSANFVGLPEYALSAAILSIDLAAIGESTYDIPTLNDQTRPGSKDKNDPFGGNNGLNQARLVAGGPVQVYAPGFRNPYDVLLTDDGRLYSIDNGGNAGWGGIPHNAGPDGNCSSALSEPGQSHVDALHLIDGFGYYGGHPNTTRGNANNTFNNNGQSAVDIVNPIECDFRPAGENGSLTTFPASTNGLTEYTASNFGGAMQGDLLAAAFNNRIYRLQLNASGQTVTQNSELFTNVGGVPLDVTAQADHDVFPGTVWVADFSNRNIVVFEPSDYDGASALVCGGGPNADDDGDGFSNADEDLNGSNSCSAADVPSDADGDRVSDALDNDDDNDGIPDNEDPFALDPNNGLTNSIPLSYQWENSDESPGFLLNLGFTGLANNGQTPWQDSFDVGELTAGGAAGVLTVDAVGPGTATGSENSLEYGFQFGVDVDPGTAPFVAHTRLIAPFLGIESEAGQEQGFFVGTGDQDNYVSLTVTGAGSIRFALEDGGDYRVIAESALDLVGADYVDLYLEIDPATNTVRPHYQVNHSGTVSAVETFASATAFPRVWLTANTGLAVGIMASSQDATPFSATWDFIALIDSDEFSASTAPRSSLYRINVGGPAVAGDDGVLWQADQATDGVALLGSSRVFDSGRTPVSVPASLAAPAAIYSTERFASAGASALDYAFDVAPGDYEVRLHFAEMWVGAFAEGVRRFAIEIEGDVVLPDLDVFARHGALAGAVYRFVAASDSQLDVSLQSIAENPALKGIEVLRLGEAAVEDNTASPVPPAISGANVLVEAESYDLMTAAGGHAWVMGFDAGASGSTLQALPNENALRASASNSPQLDYELQFSAPGTWYVWVRGRGDTNAAGEGRDDSVHVGINGELMVTAIDQFPATWVWSNSTRGGARAMIDVVSAGAHTLNVWMREDGFELDRILLTQDADFVPDGSAPVVNPSPVDVPDVPQTPDVADAPDDSPATPPASADDSPSVSDDADTVLRIEAEAYDRNTAAGGHAWQDSQHPDASGSALIALPNKLTLRETAANSPHLEYDIALQAAGTWYVWVRGRGDTNANGGGRDDSLHVGLNGTLIVEAIDQFPPEWTWSNSTRGGSRAAVEVATAGTYTLDVWMREDGLEFDQILLTRDSGFVPDDTGVQGDTTISDTTSGDTSSDMASDETQSDEDVSDDIAPGDVVYRINVGGSALAATDGPAWQADLGSAGFGLLGNSRRFVSRVDVLSVEGEFAAPTTVYETERFATGGSALDYQFAVTPGDYEVRLHFAEMWPGAFATGVRRFGIDIEGDTVLADLDVFARHGERRGVVYRFVTSSDAELDIVLSPISENPALKGIEILRHDGTGPINQAPEVSLGSAVQVDTASTWYPLATVVDDGVSDGGLTYTWSVSGDSNTASVSDSAAVRPGISFPKPGVYEVTVTVSDGELSTTASTTVLSSGLGHLAPSGG